MKKQVVDLVRGYVRNLPNEDRAFLHSRLRDRYCGDVGDAVVLMQRNPEMDRWMSTGDRAWDVYDMVDTVFQYIDCEMPHR